jgi:hypothetical protein
MGELHPLYSIKTACLCCGQTFETSRVRTSFKKAVGTDTDFYIRYRSVNPDYYVVRVCPNCGFSFTEHFSPDMTEQQKQLYHEKVGKSWGKLDLTGERDWAQAMQAFKLALVCAQIKEERHRIIASILHHIAWLYREKGDGEQERRFLRHALDAYINVYEWEDESSKNARLMYLIGELHRRLGDYKEAVFWFGRVINDKSIMDAAMIRASREQWAVLREEMLAAKMQLPAEMGGTSV